MTENDNYQTIYESRACYILYNIFKKIGKGKVIIPANICPIVPATILKAGLTPHFIDIDTKSFTINQSLLFRDLKCNPHDFSGLIWVRTYGDNHLDIKPLIQTVRAYSPSIFFVDDQCLSIPSFTVENSEADLILYSTGYSKVAEIGSGGYGFLSSDFVYERFPLAFKESAYVKLQAYFRNSIRQGSQINIPQTPWLDSRMPQLSFSEYKEKVLILSQNAVAHKAKINKIYADVLPNDIQLSNTFQNWRFNIFVKNKVHILKKLFEAGLFASSHYAPIAPLYSLENTPQADKVHNAIVNLFNDFRFNEVKAEKASLIIKDNL
ncbi:hypothetical protein [Alteromonas halophila]|uniref:DegT/DnrJ/EryC1/StrS aminotransferase family protein n=1 Tax=Alteromonas halophila TaxID=516698 RepID=A0A918JC80_9ALTE|nr:hypothetical protein [Alteromonas halophila]GGW73512.1 hypothetical protein GCM10007391_01480 [Alteromonas halophila]